MEQTSLTLRNEAYFSIIDELGKRQKEVLNVIRFNKGITNANIAKELHLPINQITGRVFELREKGLVEQCGTEIDPLTRRRVSLWKAKYGNKTVMESGSFLLRQP